MKLSKIAFLFLFPVFAACNEQQNETTPEAEPSGETEGTPVQEAMFSQQQYDALDMKIDTLGTRLMSGFVEANGELEVPPQSEATVTPVIGGNVAEIEVIEGDHVEKGHVLAYIKHPDIIKVQTDYINAVNELKFQEKEYSRQERLYEAGVGSGETFQRSEAAVESARGRVSGLEAQLQQLNVNAANVRNGNIATRVPVLSPIEGAVQSVNVKTGQFVQAQTNMFEIINTHHVHVDLMVFEQDVAKVKEGQKVYFTVASLPGTELTAEILSVGKNFEQEPKAVHVHAEINNRPENLVPGMYVRGRIAVDNNQSIALPQSAIAKDGDKYYAFTAEEEGDAWSFKPVEVIPGTEEGDWTSISLLQEVAEDARFAYNNAYYLMAEMQKGEGGGHHH